MFSITTWQFRLQYVGDIFLVDLHSLHEPSWCYLQLAALLDWLLLKNHQATISSSCARPKTLLLLDPLEALLDATAEIGALLEACPGLKLLVTSREILQLTGEQVLPIGPLALPACLLCRWLN